MENLGTTAPILWAAGGQARTRVDGIFSVHTLWTAGVHKYTGTRPALTLSRQPPLWRRSGQLSGPQRVDGNFPTELWKSAGSPSGFEQRRARFGARGEVRVVAAIGRVGDLWWFEEWRSGITGCRAPPRTAPLTTHLASTPRAQGAAQPSPRAVRPHGVALGAAERRTRRVVLGVAVERTWQPTTVRP